MQSLQDYIQTKIHLDADLIKALEENFVLKNFPKNTFLLKEHQYSKNLFFIASGTVRTFYYHKEKEVTSWFYREDQFFTSWYSFYTQQPSFENIQVLEDATIYSIDYFNFQKLIEANPKFERFARLLAEEQTAGIDHFSKGFLFMSAKEKYELLLSLFPDITLRVNLGYIASFLGITQETLSRIRNNM